MCMHSHFRTHCAVTSYTCGSLKIPSTPITGAQQSPTAARRVGPIGSAQSKQWNRSSHAVLHPACKARAKYTWSKDTACVVLSMLSAKTWKYRTVYAVLEKRGRCLPNLSIKLGKDQNLREPNPVDMRRKRIKYFSFPWSSADNVMVLRCEYFNRFRANSNGVWKNPM